MFFGARGRWKGMSKRRTPQEKARIVLEFLNTGASATELCRKHNASLVTFQDWRDKFMEGGKQALGIRQEFIWKHTYEQNGHIESFHGTLKREYVWPHGFVRFQDAEVVLVGAFADYNDDGIRSALEYVTPNEFVRKTEDENR